MSEYVKYAFNVCPECLDSGKRVILFHDKNEEFSKPCSDCGSKFGLKLIPKRDSEERS